MNQSALVEAAKILEAEWRRVLQQQDALRKHSGVSDREVRASRFSREPHVQQAIDEACRMWALEGQWPSMDAETAMFAYDRFEQALAFTSWMRHHGGEFPQSSAPEVVKFLLVDYWYVFGKDRWRRRWGG